MTTRCGVYPGTFDPMTLGHEDVVRRAPELIVGRRRDAVLADARVADEDAIVAADRGVRVQSLAAAATPLSLGVSLLAACLIGIHLASSTSGSLADVASGHGLTPMILGVLILLPLSAFESTAPLTEAGIQLERSRQSAARVMALVDGARAEGAAGALGGPREGLHPEDEHVHQGREGCEDEAQEDHPPTLATAHSPSSRRGVFQTTSRSQSSPMPYRWRTASWWSTARVEVAKSMPHSTDRRRSRV
mgnify:CR=1 FL=1